MKRYAQTRPGHEGKTPAASPETRRGPAPSFVDGLSQSSAVQRTLSDQIGQSSQASAQRAFGERLNNSPHAMAQRQRMNDLFGLPLQTKSAEDEELPEGNFEPAQREEPDEHESLQGKFAGAQRKELDEEDLSQRKFGSVQRPTPEDEAIQGSAAAPAPATQLQPETADAKNETGLPDKLKAGIESLSGLSMDPVRVHYNSSRPSQLNALAYAQGTDIHVAPGQEKHLPHEAWHVVQQAQGRVKPTMQMNEGVPVNDDKGLEHEADSMGEKAAQMKEEPLKAPSHRTAAAVGLNAGGTVVQCDDVVEEQTDWGDLVDGVAEATEMLGALSLSDEEEQEEEGEPSPNPFGLSPQGGQFGLAPPSSMPSPFGLSFGGQSGFAPPSSMPSPFGLSFGGQSGFAPPSSMPSPFGFSSGGGQSGFATPSSIPGPFGPYSAVFGQPSRLGEGHMSGQPAFGPSSMTGSPIFGQGSASGGQTFASIGSRSMSNPEEETMQQVRDPGRFVQPVAAPGRGVVQRIGAGKTQTYTDSGGTLYTFITTAGGFVNFDNPGVGYGPALAVQADVNIMDPPNNTKLNVPPAYRRTNPKQNPPLKNKRSMHFLAANWVHNKTVSMSSPSPNTWHHHKDKGRMQLINAEVHGNIKHNGGHSTWGKR